MSAAGTGVNSGAAAGPVGSFPNKAVTSPFAGRTPVLIDSAQSGYRQTQAAARRAHQQTDNDDGGDDKWSLKYPAGSQVQITAQADQFAGCYATVIRVTDADNVRILLNNKSDSNKWDADSPFVNIPAKHLKQL